MATGTEECLQCQHALDPQDPCMRHALDLGGDGAPGADTTSDAVAEPPMTLLERGMRSGSFDVSYSGWMSRMKEGVWS